MELNLEFMLKTFFLALEGIPVTLGLTLITMALGLPLAFFLALIRIYRIQVLKPLTDIYVSFARGTPMVLQILIVYSLLPSLINSLVKQLGWQLDVFALNPIWFAIVVFTFNTTAILTEIFRSALLSVDKGQLEAALSSGLGLCAAYRRIILPQAMLVALPNISNAVMYLIKGTSLAFLMTVKDVTAIAKIEASYAYNYIEAYLDIFIIYLVVCGITQSLLSLLEKKMGIYRSTLIPF